MTDTTQTGKHTNDLVDRRAYVEMGLAVLILAVQEEGVEYLGTKDGRWWMEVLDMVPDNVLRAIDCLQGSQSKAAEELAVAI